MKTSSVAFVAIASLALATFPITSDAATNATVWHDVSKLHVEGKGWTDTKEFYDRLPARAEKVVRPAVWHLSQNSAGMHVRFLSDASSISARWVLRRDALAMPHMPATGVSGLDLYVKEKGQWRWLSGGRPKDLTNEVSLVKTLEPKEREFLLYLPLYNGVRSVELGVPQGTMVKPAPASSKKPIVFYGTSILQGGCASRPGMAYPAIITRRMDWPHINLGFSGNAKSEPEIADLLAELDASLFVLDPLPNMEAADVSQRIEPMVRKIRGAFPKTPIVLIENVYYTDGDFIRSRYDRYSTANAALQGVFNRLKKSGVKNVHYIRGAKLLGSDHEATVDGAHPTDLGFLRMADEIEPTLRNLLNARGWTFRGHRN